MRAFSAWVPIVCATNSACTHLDWKPAWQISQVLSEMTNEPTTKSPTLTFLHLGADLLDDADVLVTHDLVVDGLDAAVGPQVRPADAGRGQPDDRVGRLDDLRVLALLDPDVAGGVHDYSTHAHPSLTCDAPCASTFSTATSCCAADFIQPTLDASWQGMSAPANARRVRTRRSLQQGAPPARCLSPPFRI